MAPMTRSRKAAYMAGMLFIATFVWAAVYVWDNGFFLLAALVGFFVIYWNYCGEMGASEPPQEER
ncbi:TPA_asm: hypothetical protein vir515_00011 [Caudoviricetes sp. vir515]|nr:TPA_asm: hypothetical protein vir515_00011 [Caudoviricetes sp. vir515]